ncbi:LmeA family phospholipid-binding protein [Kribbella sp. CA-247076]|uniref:LmeA family phospholipid-binding protein n=1 Tax=Kribbella sp. CA-247076 TaxID=3239941 RepID=UPI003D9026D5
MGSRRPRRWLRRLVVTVVVLGCLVVGADRAAAWVAEDRLATMAADEAAKYDVQAADTSVEIGGFGFLPQVVREEFSTVTLTMRQPTFSSVPAEDLVVTMDTVHVPRALVTGGSGTAVTIDSTEMKLRLSPAELTKLAARATNLENLGLSIVDGRLHAKLSVRGREVDATLSPKVEQGRIVLAVDQLSDSIPSVIRTTVSRLLARGITLPEMPFGASLKQVAVEGNSVVLVATADNLQFAG